MENIGHRQITSEINIHKSKSKYKSKHIKVNLKV